MSHSTATPPPTPPPLLACVEQVELALKAAAESDPMFLRTSEKADALGRLTTLSSQVEALRLRVLAASHDVAVEHACRNVADWMAPATRTDRRVAHAQAKLAEALDSRWTTVATGLAEGTVHLDQARVIVQALDALPDEVGVEVERQAEQRLVEHAATFAPAPLARLGRRILDVIAPEIGDEQERRALDAAERKAERQTRLDFERRGDGSTDIAANVPDAVAARLKTYLDAYTSPRQSNGLDPATGTRLPADRQRGEAFCALIERLDPAALPDHGGRATTVVITMPIDALLTGLGTAELLGTEQTITAGQARRFACTAALVPAVLGSKSEVLDLGHTTRLYKPAQRLALAVQHPHCRAEGCQVPAPWCEAHHDTPWSLGGRTDLRDGVLLCHFHHKRAHDDWYSTERLPSGDHRYNRRT